MKCLDTFSGIGGMTRLLNVEYVTMVEIDPHAREILKKRYPGVPIHDDICTLDPPPHDILTGGFPCQDISSAGKRKGLGGTKSVLFYEMLRIIKKVHPRLVFLENVQNITTMEGVMIPVVESLCSEGYDITWCCLKAANVGAPMCRRRWFCLGKKTREPSEMKVDMPKKIDKSASVIDGIYTKIKMPILPVNAQKIKLEPLKGNHGCRGNVLTHSVTKKYWATPRTHLSHACRNLTKRGCGDLGSMLRFAVDTPEDQKHLKTPCIEWVEWLMGLPIGFTDLECETPTKHNGWVEEHPQRLGPRTKDAAKRHFRLGNMCVPQMAKKAFEILTERLSEDLEDSSK
jgi:DNA (cytosine-5)-methyltransferase 1